MNHFIYITHQDICMVSSSCAHPPGQYWRTLQSPYLLSMTTTVVKRKSMHCCARSSIFSSPIDWSRKFLSVKLILLAHVEYGYIISARRTSWIEKKGWTQFGELREANCLNYSYKLRIYIERYGYLPVDIIIICGQVTSFPRASGNRNTWKNPWLTQKSRSEIPRLFRERYNLSHQIKTKYFDHDYLTAANTVQTTVQMFSNCWMRWAGYEEFCRSWWRVL